MQQRMLVNPSRRSRAIMIAALVLVSSCGADTSAPTPPSVASVFVTTPNDTVAVGDTIALSVQAQSSSGQVIENIQYTWSSSDTNVASVDQSGRLALREPGSVTVTATAVGPSANVQTQISGHHALLAKNYVRTITLSRASGTDTVGMGDTVRIAAAARNGSGNAVPTAQFNWTVSDTSIAQIDATGAMIARAMGTVTVAAQASGPPDIVRGKVTGSTQMTIRLAFVSISSGGSEHTCGVGRGGVTYCWGSAYEGQIGNGASGLLGTIAPIPVRVSGPDLFASVAAGPTNSSDGGHTCAITTGGALDCWGSGAYGMLGNGVHNEGIPPYFVTSPIRVSSGPFKQVTGGTMTNCALTTSGDAYCAGSNYLSQLGVDTLPELCGQNEAGGAYIATCSTKFLHIPAPAFTSLSQGGGTTCGLTGAGQAWCWGRNDLGNAGVGYITPVRAPSQVVGGIAFTQISIGGMVSCGLSANGTAYCWGGNQFGGIGNGTWSINVGILPTPVTSAVAFKSISVGESHACALTTGGDAYCWGTNRYGELGAATSETCGPPNTGGTSPCSTLPVQVQNAPKFTTITTGWAFTCGLTNAGSAYCWGNAQYGALGNGSTSGSSLVPVRVKDTQ
jgi:alpha-tubulin suppressor-like RCC1 family protein